MSAYNYGYNLYNQIYTYYMKTLADRINARLKEFGHTQTYLAKRVGVSPVAIQKLCAGKTQTSKKIVDIAKVLKVDVEWLIHGDAPQRISSWDSNTPLDLDDVELPYFRDVEIAAGNGERKIEFNHGRKLRFSQRTLDNLGIKVQNAACVTVSGNSMMPVMPHGSTVGVDTGNTELVDGDIYVIGHNNHLRVKIMYALPWGGVRLKSFNSTEWPDETYESTDAVVILGRVFWYSALI